MSRLLMAFLGTNKYTPCNYELNEKGKVSNVRYIQEALASFLCKDWTVDDRIIIFLTKDAKAVNWVDNGYKDEGGKPNIGLKTRLDALKLKAKIIPKDIPEGKKEDEIWRIFDCVLDQIKKDNEVIFDITHAFRSLPMLAVIILNYAKVLKNIQIKGVYYGAFESLGSSDEVKKMNIEDRNAPIFDLTPFVRLFNWTNATANFLTYGDVKDIHKLTNEEKDEITINLSEQLRKFTQSIQTCRGPAIISFDIKNLKELVEQGSSVKLINPLLDEIYTKIKSFNNNDIKNGYAAVEWCIEHNLIQQGYTLLQETMISDIVEKQYGSDKITDKLKRELVSQAFNIKSRKIPESDWKEPAKGNEEDIQKIIGCLDDNFVKMFDKISQHRNDIDHAGFRKNPMEDEVLIANLKKYYIELKAGDKKCIKKPNHSS